jgi:hypothetical protein
MNDEHDFYRELSDVPELPPDLFGSIDKRIRRRALMHRSLIGLAAALVLSIGLFGMFAKRHYTSDTFYPEITAELQNVHDYLNAGDLEDDLALYAVFNDY